MSVSKPTLQEPLQIVSIGGGTGLSTLLTGLKKYARRSPGSTGASASARKRSVEITAVVTVTDDGGSSGRLRREFDILPPGDIRNCMVALSEDEALLSRLFQHRFAAGRGLKGHSFGNLFLAAMNQITGDFAHAVKLSSEILAIRGRIFPSTSANVTLEAMLNDGSIVRGETNITKSRKEIDSVQIRPIDCDPLPETLEAICSADLITLGPGSLYTSIIPNLLVNGIAKAIQESPALKVYFVNLMWQPGETINFSASRHIEAIHKHAGRNLIDCAVLNTAPISADLKKKYAKQDVMPVENDFDRLSELGVKVVTADLVGDASLVRHDSVAVANIIIDLASRSRVQKVRARALEMQRKKKR